MVKTHYYEAEAYEKYPIKSVILSVILGCFCAVILLANLLLGTVVFVIIVHQVYLSDKKNIRYKLKEMRW